MYHNNRATLLRLNYRDLKNLATARPAHLILDMGQLPKITSLKHGLTSFEKFQSTISGIVSGEIDYANEDLLRDNISMYLWYKNPFIKFIGYTQRKLRKFHKELVALYPGAQDMIYTGRELQDQQALEEIMLNIRHFAVFRIGAARSMLRLFDDQKSKLIAVAMICGNEDGMLPSAIDALNFGIDDHDALGALLAHDISKQRSKERDDFFAKCAELQKIYDVEGRRLLRIDEKASHQAKEHAQMINLIYNGISRINHPRIDIALINKTVDDVMSKKRIDIDNIEKSSVEIRQEHHKVIEVSHSLLYARKPILLKQPRIKRRFRLAKSAVSLFARKVLTFICDMFGIKHGVVRKKRNVRM